ncbi:hypothetical protein DZC78_12400 [Olleya aquimaris]|nr:hypothetical protein [Olleya sediminilitoris]AXO81151.1 hypothetical protein DZC78_12400 [Olleya aquimaris]
MKVFKIFQYAYLVFAVLFLYDAFVSWGETRAYMSLLLGLTAVFMFFFKQKFNKKFDNKNRK